MSLKKLTLLLLVAIVFAACGSDDDDDKNNGITPPIEKPTTPPVESSTDFPANSRITRTLTSYEGGEKLPYLEFAYDENNVLTKAVEYIYDTSESDSPIPEKRLNKTIRNSKTMELSSTRTSTFERTNGKISVNTTIVYPEAKPNETEKYILELNKSNQVIKKTEYDDNTVYKESVYEWTGNKLTKSRHYYNGENTNEAEYLFTYLGDNVTKVFWTYEFKDDAKTSNTRSKTISTEYNTKRQNVFSLMPIEFVLLDNEDVFVKCLSANEVINQSDKLKFNKFDANGKKLMYENEGSSSSLSYTYLSNNLPSEIDFIESYDYELVDYRNEENNNKDSSTNKGKIYMEYLAK